MAEARAEYLRALYVLSKSDVAAWATFVEAFKGYTLYEYERMLATQTGEALVSLGMARKMRELRDDFIDIEARGDKVRVSRVQGTL